MRKSVFVAVLVAAPLALPTAAAAKCVNVGLSAAPDGSTNIRVFFPNPGAMAEPAVDLRPEVRIRQGDTIRAFPSSRTGRRGVYRVNVTFPGPGRWRFSVDDGFDRLEKGAGLIHRFDDVVVAPGQTGLEKLPERRRGECDEMIAEEMKPVALDSPGGQLSPEIIAVKPAVDGDDGGVSAMSLAAAGAVLLLVLGLVGIRRRRNS